MKHLVIGLGEIGNPIYHLLAAACDDVKAIDPAQGFHPPKRDENVFCMHICIPGELKGFENIVSEYIRTYTPLYTVIHATVPVGTTRRIQEQTQSFVYHSPVLGKHANDQMTSDMLKYPKFISGTHFKPDLMAKLSAAGFKPRWMGNKPENAELAKILQTTLVGYLIAWTQMAQQLCDTAQADYDFVSQIWKLQASDYDIQNKFPGVIGGHCIMQNLPLLDQLTATMLTELIRQSNETTIKRGEWVDDRAE